MGSFDGAELFELLSLYILPIFGEKYGKYRLGLYRDHGLACFGYISAPQTDKISKDVIKIIEKDFDLSITCKTNLKAINFLDVTLHLTTGQYQPYNKPDNNPLYINILSNHPPSIIKNLPGNISKRITIYQQRKQHLISLRIYITMHLSKVDLNTRLHFKKSKIHLQ